MNRDNADSAKLRELHHGHLAAISYEVTVLNGSAPVVISSEAICEQEDQDEEDGHEQPADPGDAALQTGDHHEPAAGEENKNANPAHTRSGPPRGCPPPPA